MAFPALTQTRSSRMNKPYDANAVQLDLAQSVIFAIIQHLLDTATGGTLTGTRNAASIWNVKGSSNSVSVSLVGVNHITARTNLVWAAAGAAHSWIWLEKGNWQIVIDCINGTNTNIVIAASRVAVPFTGGTVNDRPTSTEEFLWSTTSTGNSPQNYLADTTTGATCNTHFVTGTDEQFCFFASRAGTGVVFLTVAFVKTTGADVADVRNAFWLGSASTSGRGSCGVNEIANAAGGCVGRSPNGLTVVTTGGAAGLRAGGTDMSGTATYGTDAFSGKYNTTPIAVWAGNSGAQYAYRGMLPDIYTTTAAVGEPISLAGVVTRTVIGDYVFPCPGAAPTV